MKHLLALLIGMSALGGTTQIDTLQSNQIKLKGATSGVITLQAPAISPTHTLTISVGADITMTTPNTSFTAARTDAGQNFIGTQAMGGSLVLSGGFDFSAATSYTGTWPYANGGSGATSQAGLIANARGAKSWTSSGALQAGAADFGGQMQFTSDGVSFSIARDTTAGDTHEAVVLLNDLLYLQGLDTTAGTITAHGLTATTGTFTGTLHASAEFDATTTANVQHQISSARSADDVVNVSNSAANGFSAMRFTYDGDSTGKIAVGVANSGTGAEWAGKTYLQFFDEGGTNPSPDFVVKQFGKYSGMAAQNYDRVEIKSGGDIYLRQLTPGTISGAAALYIEGSDGRIGIGTATLAGSAQLTVSGALNIGTGTNISRIKHGTSGALTAGSIVITDSSVSANTRFFFSVHTRGTITLPQSYDAATRSAGTSFTITSSSAIDTSTVDYLEIEP